MMVERNKLNKKVLYHFAIFEIIIEILIEKDWNKSASKTLEKDTRVSNRLELDIC